MLSLLLLAAAAPLPAPVRGDFDRDGRMDVASVRARAGGGYELVVRPGAPDRPVAVIAWFDRAADLYLDAARAGRWKTWCGKGGGDDGAPCPRNEVQLKGGELMFGIEEASASVVVWTGKRFEVVLLSD